MGASLSAYDGPPVATTCRCVCRGSTTTDGVVTLDQMRDCHCVCDFRSSAPDAGEPAREHDEKPREPAGDAKERGEKPREPAGDAKEHDGEPIETTTKDPAQNAKDQMEKARERIETTTKDQAGRPRGVFGRFLRGLVRRRT